MNGSLLLVVQQQNRSICLCILLFSTNGFISLGDHVGSLGDHAGSLGDHAGSLGDHAGSLGDNA